MFFRAWADSNSAEEAITSFLENHVCTTVCNMLKLGRGGKAINLNWKKNKEGHSHSLEKILASRNRDPDGEINFFEHDSDEIEINMT